ncbi:MAG: TetR/AcrR family transcriptional regulator [Desulfobacterales bacterium]|nr:TetR/AcrR family transcriptional regulator [Desulfobacterales bacterium]MCP4163708.1 TetR/AcrR family transcriptional regulator [Deltaproteobacteria bacterium]
MTVNKSPRKHIILKEAASLFREKGFMASTLRELAKRSGVQGGSIYHHFSSKQEILYQIMDYTMTSLIYKLDAEIKDIKDPLKKLRKAIKFHIEYHVTDTDETFVTDTEIRSLDNENLEKIQEKRSVYEGKFIKILNNGNSAKTMAISNTKIAAMAILQMCTGVSYWYKKDSHLKIDDITEQYVNFICWGVAGKSI